MQNRCTLEQRGRTGGRCFVRGCLNHDARPRSTVCLTLTQTSWACRRTDVWEFSGARWSQRPVLWCYRLWKSAVFTWTDDWSWTDKTWSSCILLQEVQLDCELDVNNMSNNKIACKISCTRSTAVDLMFQTQMSSCAFPVKLVLSPAAASTSKYYSSRLFIYRAFAWLSSWKNLSPILFCSSIVSGVITSSRGSTGDNQKHGSTSYGDISGAFF